MSYPTADFKLTPTGLLNSSSLVMGQISNNLNLLATNPTNITTGFKKMANLDFTTQGIHLLRIGKKAIVTIPNFGYWKVRIHLLFQGTMPVTKSLPNEWYDTPNLHMCTIKDFVNFCNRKK